MPALSNETRGGSGRRRPFELYVHCDPGGIGSIALPAVDDVHDFLQRWDGCTPARIGPCEFVYRPVRDGAAQVSGAIKGGIVNDHQRVQVARGMNVEFQVAATDFERPDKRRDGVFRG